MIVKSALRRGKLIDKRRIFRKVVLMTISDNKRNSRRHKRLSVDDVAEIERFYFWFMREHIRSEDPRIFPIRGIGMVYYDEGLKYWFMSKISKGDNISDEV